MRLIVSIGLACSVILGCGSEAFETSNVNEVTVSTPKSAEALSMTSKGEVQQQALERFGLLYSAPFSEKAPISIERVRISKEWNSVVFEKDDSAIMGLENCYVSRLDWPGVDPEAGGYFAIGENSVDLGKSVLRIFKDSDGDGVVVEGDEIATFTFQSKILSALCASEGIAYACFQAESSGWEVVSILDTDGDDVPDTLGPNTLSTDAIFAGLSQVVSRVNDISVDPSDGRVELSASLCRDNSIISHFGASTIAVDANKDGVFESAVTGRVTNASSAPSISMRPIVSPSAGDTRFWAQAERKSGTTSFSGEEFELVDVVDAVVSTTSANERGYMKFDLANALIAGEEYRVRHKTSARTSSRHTVLASPTRSADIAWVDEGVITGSPIKIWGERLPLDGVYQLLYSDIDSKSAKLDLTVIGSGAGFVEVSFDVVELASKLKKTVHPMLTILENDGVTFVDMKMPILVDLE